MERKTQALRLPGLHGSSRGVCSSHFCKVEASRWLLPGLAPWLRLPADADPVADDREPWLVLVEVMDFAEGWLLSLGFWGMRVGFLALETLLV